MKNRVKKADERLTRNAQKELNLVYFGTCIVLAKEYGWGKKKIKNLNDVASEIFHECGDNQSKSLIQMCEEETGIELRNTDGQSWRETPYLNQNKWDEVKNNVYSASSKLQRCYQLRVKQCMDKWKKAIIMSSVVMALHRKEKWGYQRIARFIELLEECIANYNDSEREMLKAVYELTGLNYKIVNAQELILVKDSEVEE